MASRSINETRARPARTAARAVRACASQPTSTSAGQSPAFSRSPPIGEVVLDEALALTFPASDPVAVSIT